MLVRFDILDKRYALLSVGIKGINIYFKVVKSGQGELVSKDFKCCAKIITASNPEDGKFTRNFAPEQGTSLDSSAVEPLVRHPFRR